MKFQLVMSTHVGAELVTSMYYWDVTSSIKTQEDMIKLEEMDYDLILGMNWLPTYHAYVDCHQKRITFKF